MKSTVAERLVEAMNGPPKVSGVALAKACGVAPPSVSGWRTGDSKTLEASNLLAAAKRMGVRADWLANGIGPKFEAKPEPAGSPYVIHTPSPDYLGAPDAANEAILEVAALFNSLDAVQREGALAILRIYAAHVRGR